MGHMASWSYQMWRDGHLASAAVIPEPGEGHAEAVSSERVSVTHPSGPGGLVLGLGQVGWTGQHLTVTSEAAQTGLEDVARSST